MCTASASPSRYTALDLAVLYNHPKCAELLTKVGALSKETIRDFAATCIQAAYRGHRWVDHADTDYLSEYFCLLK